jgi:hypothetical protein
VLSAAPAGAATGPVEIGPPRPGVTYSGVADHGPKADTLRFGQWRGAPVQAVTDFLGGSTWRSISDVSWTRGRWSGVRAHYTWSMFMLPKKEPGTLREVSQGRYDWVFKRAGAGLVKAGYAHSTIRLGWENTGTWYRWAMYRQGNRPADYAAAYRRIVTDLRSVKGQHFTFDWNISENGRDPRRGYPGDRYVDFIGGDFYDNLGGNLAAQWRVTQSGKYGLDWLAWFAGRHHKRLTLPEWGLRYNCDRRWSGGDDAMFIRQMRAWVVHHRPAIETYFNDDDNPCQRSAMLPDRGRTPFPRASALYRRMW